MKVLFVILGATALLVTVPAARAANDVKTFKTEAGAQASCPKDIVVWGSPAGGVFYLQGRRHYGTSKDGHYLCLEEAINAGMEQGGNDR
jgi:hypothetical protein